LVQHLAPADAATLVGIRMEDALGRKLPGSKYLPTIEPHPANAEQSARLQAFATDWGAGMIGKDVPASVLTPDDPPMFTCHNNPAGAASAGVVAYRNAGAVAEFVTLDAPKGTHVPDGKTPGKLTDGTATTWYDSVCGFFDAYLKAPKCAAAPEAFPAGGPLAGPTDVRLASVYAAGAIHYTLDGTAPTAASPRYDKPVTVKPGETLKAITIAPGLEVSAVSSVTFTAGAAAPVITNTAYTFTAKKGEPFSVTFQAKSDKPVSWYLAGKVSHVPAAVDPNAPAGAPKKPSVPWLTLDPTTGVLSGTATTVGVNVVIVAANVPDGKTTLADARTVMVTVTE
jgi:hypothetical protein